mgnify:CR=1 FL=1
MPIYSIFRMKNHALLMALSAAYPVIGYSAGAAQIDFATGAVTAVSSSGAQRPLVKGAEISNGDTIRTGDGGRAQVRFSDGALISLQPTTEFRVDNYEFSNQPTGQEKGFFSLIKGGMRTITGLIGRSNRDNYKVTTSVATIGIRGTHFGALLCQADCGSVQNATGSAPADGLHVDVTSGSVSVTNAGGQTLVNAGQFGFVPNAATPPAVVPPSQGIQVTMPPSIAQNKGTGSTVGTGDGSECRL